jgi:hypothetical protein
LKVEVFWLLRQLKHVLQTQMNNIFIDGVTNFKRTNSAEKLQGIKATLAKACHNQITCKPFL